MDPVSHVLLGASLGHVAAGRVFGRSAALAAGLAALLPDADIFIRSPVDPLVAIEYHRGLTHSLVAVPVGAAIVAAMWLLPTGFRQPRRWLGLWATCCLAYLSHILLDAATSYGTQLAWPFSRERFGWDLISIIDPVFTLSLLTGLLLALRRPATRPAAIALAFAFTYLLVGGIQRSRAEHCLHALAASRGHRPERVEVMPTLANNLVWRALYLHEGRIVSDRIRVGWFTAPRIREGWNLPIAGDGDLSPSEHTRNRRRSFERFAWFSEEWVARSPTDPTLLADMRYSLSAEAFDPIWAIRFTAPDSAADVEWVNRSRQRKVSVIETWREISGGDPRFRSMPRSPL